MSIELHHKDKIVLVDQEGHKVDIAIKSEAECEECDWCVCSPVEWYLEPPLLRSVKGTCTQCGKGVWFSSLTAPKKPKKLCIPCFTVLAQRESEQKTVKE